MDMSVNKKQFKIHCNTKGVLQCGFLIYHFRKLNNMKNEN